MNKICENCGISITEDDFNDDICNDCLQEEAPNDYEGDF